jgi:Icc protein
MTVTLVQVSDCHLGAAPGTAYRGQDPDANLHRLTPAIQAFDPDVLVLTGDLSEDGSIESYRRLAQWAARFGVRVWWIPGNHDDPGVMAEPFEQAGFEAGPRVEAGGWQFLLLDSRWPNDPAGELTEQRLAPWDELDADRPFAAFVHHQPVAVGAHWIDKVGMRHPERLWQRIEAGPRPAFIAFGHVHQRFRQRHRGVECLAGPSSAANSLAGTPRFTAGEITPMARWFRLADRGFRSGYLSEV